MPIWHQSPKLTPRYFLETPRLFGYPNNSNELSFLWLNPIYTFCNTNFQTIHYHFFLLKVCQNIQAIPESSFASGFPINKTFHFASPSTSIIEYSESAYKS